jgi:hypothetical protein
MSDNNLILSDAEAEAAKELLKTAQGFGGFVRDILGTVPEDLIGLLGGDWLKVRRFENILRTIKKAHDRLEKDGIKPEAASLSVSLPILRAAADESREELQDLWADLLAASADPARSRSFRNEFIEIIKKMDPLDAVVLKSAYATGGRVEVRQRKPIAEQMGATPDAVAVSFSNLCKLGLFADAIEHVNPTSLGREFMRAVKP